MFFLKKVSELEDEDDMLVSPDIFDSEKGLTLIDFIYNVVPTIVIKKENVSEIRVDDFDKVTREIEEMARKMQDNDDTWREERRQFEEYRMKEANVNQRKRNDLEKQIHDSKERMEEYRLRQEEIALED